jgi:hypothetical protein
MPRPVSPSLLSFLSAIAKIKFNKNGEEVIQVDYAQFEYSLPDGGVAFEAHEANEDIGFTTECFLEDNDLDESHAHGVRKAIKEVFAQKRSKIEEQKQLLLSEGYDEETLNSIKLAKIYPKNVDESIRCNHVSKYYQPLTPVEIF